MVVCWESGCAMHIPHRVFDTALLFFLCVSDFEYIAFFQLNKRVSFFSSA